MKKKRAGYDIRLEEYNYIHDNSKKDWDTFIKGIAPKDSDIILDLGGGYGDTTQKIKKIANPKIFIIDSSKVQLERLKKRKILDESNIRLGDIRISHFRNNYFSKCVAKMILHEVSLQGQLNVLKIIFKQLKRGGKIIIWELALTKQNQTFFQNFIRKKDELCGFTSLVKERYFPTYSETINNLKKVGFINIRDFYTKKYRPQVIKRYHELVSLERSKGFDDNSLELLSKKRAAELISYARKIVPPLNSLKLEYTKKDLSFLVEKKILVAQKP